MKVLIAGAGKLGMKLAQALLAEDCDVTVLDSDENVIDYVNNTLDVLTVNENALNFEVLKELDIETYDLLLATTTSDEANVLVSTIAKKLGVNEVIARVRNPEYHSQLQLIKEELGIDHVINPDYATAEAIEKYLLKRYLLMSDEFAGGRVKLVDFNIGQDPEFVGKKIMELTGFKNMLIAAISRNGKSIVPNGSTVLREKDVIMLVGESSQIDAFDARYSGINKHQQLRRVMIIGGGKLGLYLGLLLDEANVETTIVEINRARCEQLMERLPDSMIINADGTDFNVLEEEMLKTYDAFVCATGIDETNLLMALAVKQFGIYKSVAKTSRQNYKKILDRLEVDAAFNTSYTTAKEIIKLIRGSGSITVSLMNDGETEFSEIQLKRGAVAIGQKISELNLPEGMLITSIVRDGGVIIPGGGDTLRENDRIVVLTTYKKVNSLKEYFFPRARRWFR
ncbi:Trk system potassium transporter TrkA [Peptoniphilus equinus]|uniref:Trk system potassium uptake protein TrkA n=1 Tax=Peptoniphilus equinus TaxID=3016343 RepID=A0ABY7QVL1_9FIRM|nr:Trk system potassium transporter TrkA [Peptoniphilus equinus]WBW50129.1 Trk system potassium transporter TrkA [Peptoniphilus equinus]